MPSAMSKTPRRNSRRRTIGVTRPQPTAAITVTGATKNTTKITVTFDQPVLLNGVPQYTTNLAGVTASSAVATGPTTIWPRHASPRPSTSRKCATRTSR